MEAEPIISTEDRDTPEDAQILLTHTLNLSL